MRTCKKRNSEPPPFRIAQLRDNIPKIARLLEVWGQINLVAMYGAVGNNLPIDELWRPIAVTPTQIQTFINRSETQGVFRLGASDLIIQNPEADIKFTFSHESDIHFVSDNESFVDQVLKLWLGQGLTVYISDYTPVGRPVWEKIDP